MLKKLVIKNLAIFEATEIDFQKGLTAILGETGAGKSLVVDSLFLLLGGRASSELIRQGADKAYVAGLFDLPEGGLKRLLIEKGADVSSGEVLIERTVTHSKSLLKANDVPLSLNELSSHASDLADIHGQLDFASLFNPLSYLSLIDGFDKEGITPLSNEYQTALEAYSKALAARNDWERRAQAFEEARDYHEAQYAELVAAALYRGEEEELQTELRALRDFDKATEAQERLQKALNGPLFEALDELEEALEESCAYDSSLEEPRNVIRERNEELKDLARSIQRKRREAEFDPARLEELQERDYFLSGLKRKYRTDYDGLLSKRDELASHLSVEGGFEEEGERLSKELAEALEKALALGEKLSKKRKITAERLSKALEKELNGLGLKTRLKIVFANYDRDASCLKENGLDEAAFLIETNEGEGLKELSKVVSGGEASRIMLGYKAVLAKEKRLPTIVFDEVDTGISGDAAQKVLEELKEMSLHSQVICITHLPLLAAKSDAAFLIEKATDGKRTRASCERLSKEGLIKEVASLLAGKKASKKELEYAASIVNG